MTDLFAPITTKQCTSCLCVKETSAFYKGTASFAKMSWCKNCSHENRRERNQQKPFSRRDSDRKRAESVDGRSYILWKAAKRRAEIKNKPFGVTIERIKLALENGFCERTGVKFDFSKDPLRSRHPYSPSVDRINSFGEYEDDNIQIVVSMYNLGKSQFTDEEFINFCRKVAKHVV